MIRGHILIGVAAALGLVAMTGCNDFLEALGGSDTDRTLVNVFATHHATPEASGIVPDRGGDGEVRTFDNDEGWTVNLGDGFVTTRGVTLHACDGAAMTVDTYFGSLAEDLSAEDLDRLALGGAHVGPAEFCSLTVHYGPFDARVDDPPFDTSAADLDGTTTKFAGWAVKGEDTVPFEFHTSAELDVHVDLSVRVTGDEDFPLEVTLAKTYDRFFDGIDFAATDDSELAQQSLALLEVETRAKTE